MPITEARLLPAIMRASSMVFARSCSRGTRWFNRPIRYASSASTTRAENNSSLAIGQANLVGQGPGAVDPAISSREKAKAAVLATDPHVERGGEHCRSPIGEAVDHPDRRLCASGNFVAAPAWRAVSIQLLLGVAAIILALLVDVATG